MKNHLEIVKNQWKTKRKPGKFLNDFRFVSVFMCRSNHEIVRRVCLNENANENKTILRWELAWMREHFTTTNRKKEKTRFDRMTANVYWVEIAFFGFDFLCFIFVVVSKTRNRKFTFNGWKNLMGAAILCCCQWRCRKRIDENRRRLSGFANGYIIIWN